MTEETTLAVQTSPEPSEQGRQEMAIPSGTLGNNFFGVETKEEPKVETPVQTQQPKVETQPIVETPKEEPKVWHKDFGWETEEAAKAEIEQLKKLKDQPTQFKFENDESRKLVEAISKGDRKTVLNILATQDKLESLAAADVNDNTAEAIIKLSMQLKSKVNGVELSDDEVNYKYNKEFGLPKEPIRKEDELDEEFEARQADWKQIVSDIKMNRSIEAKLAKPELEKLKTQIVLPDISQPSAQKPPTQEELEAAKRYDDNYVQSVDNSMKELNGFSVKVKNEAVGLPETTIDYVIVDTEKADFAKELKDFSNVGYDTNALFAARWLNEDKTLNTKAIAEDRYWLENRDKIVQKLANEAATKAVDAYIKGKKQININETSQQGTATLKPEDKTELDVVRDQFFG